MHRSLEARHLSWAILDSMIEGGIPRRLSILGEPSLELIIAAGGREIGLLMPHSSESNYPLLKFRKIQLGQREVDGEKRLFLSTSSRESFQEFYSVLMGVADDIQLKGYRPTEAVSRQLEAWNTLLVRISTLSPQAEVGLFGELWFLSQLIKSRGVSAVDAWTGPVGEVHDFRFDGFDLEIKTTRSSRRSHTINGLNQLLPTVGKVLYIISIQLQIGGASGKTLPQLAAEISHQLASDPLRHDDFRKLLNEAFGLDDADAAFYRTTFQLRTEPVLIAVDERCPALTPHTLERCSVSIERIAHVEYVVDLEGLGLPMGCDESAAILSLNLD